RQVREDCKELWGWKFLLSALCVFVFQCVSLLQADDRATVLVVVGAAGEKDFGEQFAEWAGRWKQAAEKARADFAVIGLDDSGSTTDRELLQARLAAWAAPSEEVAWLVFIGHGTFDGKTAKFSLRGPDVTPSELAGWLKAIDRPVAVIDCTS